MVSPELRRTRARARMPDLRPADRLLHLWVWAVLSGDWLLQNPMFGGYAAIEAYPSAEKIAIIAVTYAQDASRNR